ncbi:MAG: phosphotransferase [Acidimicrobiales bacterium]
MSLGVLATPGPGTPADSPTALMRPDDLVAALARFLQRVHGSAPAGDAEPVTASATLATARARVADGAVDASSFDEPYRSQSSERLLTIASDLADLVEGRGEIAAVTVHGSLRLGDLLLDGGEVTGWAVPAVALVGDPYVDLAFLARDLAGAVGPAAVPALFDAYGLDRPDPLRIEFWVTVGQLLR